MLNCDLLDACPAASAQILRIDTMPRIEDGGFGSAHYLWRSRPDLFFYILCRFRELRVDLLSWFKSNHVLRTQVGSTATLADQCGADLKPDKAHAAVSFVALLPDFLGVLFSVSDSVTRTALLAVPFVQKALLNKSTVSDSRFPSA